MSVAAAAMKAIDAVAAIEEGNDVGDCGGS